jgi:hypothetical protein
VDQPAHDERGHADGQADDHHDLCSLSRRLDRSSFPFSSSLLSLVFVFVSVEFGRLGVAVDLSLDLCGLVFGAGGVGLLLLPWQPALPQPLS